MQEEEKRGRARGKRSFGTTTGSVRWSAPTPLTAKENAKTLSKGSAREESGAGEGPTRNNCQLGLEGGWGGPSTQESA